jgi:hypothetical protein
MKSKPLSVIAAFLTASLLAGMAVSAQDKKEESKPKEEKAEESKKEEAKEEKKEENQEEESAEEDEQNPSAEELEKQSKEAKEKDKATLAKMMAVFKSLEGEWIGQEKVDYNEQFPGNKNRKDISWDDEWKGFYTQEGRYFEMTGKTSNGEDSTYHWYVTFDSDDDIYRAWNFGTGGYGEFTGELSDDGKSVIWTRLSSGEMTNVEDTFELRAEGGKCKAKGEVNLVSPGGDKLNYSKQSSSYTRKKLEI